LAPNKAAITAWFDRYARDSGDYMPHLDEYHLPAGSVAELFRGYSNFRESIGRRSGGYNYFLRTVNLRMGDYMKIRKIKQFTKCDKCDHYDEERRKAKSPAAKERWARKKEKHMDWQMEERQKYYANRLLSTLYPEKYLSIIIDGMDQAKTSLLRIRRDVKESASLEKVPMTLIAAINHGSAPHASIFTFPQDFPKDSSLTCQIIANKISLIIDECKARGETLPPVCFLQLDNTYRENKNTCVLNFLAMLVKLGVFQKVHHIYAIHQHI
jgi:hypothetical protein